FEQSKDPVKLPLEQLAYRELNWQNSVSSLYVRFILSIKNEPRIMSPTAKQAPSQPNRAQIEVVRDGSKLLTSVAELLEEAKDPRIGKRKKLKLELGPRVDPTAIESFDGAKYRVYDRGFPKVKIEDVMPPQFGEVATPFFEAFFIPYGSHARS